MKIRQVALSWAAGLLATVCVPGLAWAFGKPEAHIWLPEGITTTSPLIDDLFYLVLWITGIAFVLVQGTLIFFLIRYRSGAKRPVAYIHGSHLAEIIWTAIPAAILIFLAFKNQQVWSLVHGTPPAADLRIKITGEQFAWNFQYPGPDGKLDTEDDITTINQLHLPVNKTALLSITSKDVIHSFFVPQFRVKHDAVPGRLGRLWVKPVKAGSYDIACAELCGLGHYRMKAYLTVDETQEAFDAWLEEMREEYAE